MKAWLNRIFVALLFAALVLALLWFQGLIWRPQHAVARVPELPQPGAHERIVKVVARRTARVQEHPGFVEPIDAAHVSARVAANVLEVGVREGERVAAGQVLVVLDDRDARARVVQARAARDAAKAQADAAKLAFERVERLERGGAATEQEWESARAARDSSDAALQRAEAALDEADTASSWYEVRAPFEGAVLERSVEPGQLAAPGQPLVTIYRADRLRVAVAVPEELSSRFVAGAECALAFDGVGALAGVVSRVLPAADARSGAVTLHIRPADASALRPGQLGRLQIAIGERDALFVPASSVERIGQIERVRLVENGRVRPVAVRTGKRDGDELEVLSGLKSGDEVAAP